MVNIYFLLSVLSVGITLFSQSSQGCELGKKIDLGGNQSILLKVENCHLKVDGNSDLNFELLSCSNIQYQPSGLKVCDQDLPITFSGFQPWKIKRCLEGLRAQILAALEQCKRKVAPNAVTNNSSGAAEAKVPVRVACDIPESNAIEPNSIPIAQKIVDVPLNEVKTSNAQEVETKHARSTNPVFPENSVQKIEINFRNKREIISQLNQMKTMVGNSQNKVLKNSVEIINSILELIKYSLLSPSDTLDALIAKSTTDQPLFDGIAIISPYETSTTVDLMAVSPWNLSSEIATTQKRYSNVGKSMMEYLLNHGTQVIKLDPASKESSQSFQGMGFEPIDPTKGKALKLEGDKAVQFLKDLSKKRKPTETY